MATSNADDDPSSKISPWASGENLRHVEKEVLIPKIVREKAKTECDDFVKGRLRVEQHYSASRVLDKSARGARSNFRIPGHSRPS